MLVGTYIFHFYSNFQRKFCKQTVENLIRRCIVLRLIWFCTVCRCPTKRMLGLHGLMKMFQVSTRDLWMSSPATLCLLTECRLLITFANSLYPDQDQGFRRAWPRSKLFDTLMVFLKAFFEKVDFGKTAEYQKRVKKLPRR